MSVCIVRQPETAKSGATWGSCSGGGRRRVRN